MLFLTFAVPGLVGWLGIERRRPALLVAAALASFVGAFVAFSGVTLIFQVPALLLLVSAVRVQATDPPRAHVAILPAVLQAVAACAIAALLLGAAASALLLTDDACWVEYPAGIEPRIQAVPYATGEVSVPTGATSISCSSGVISVRGVGLAGVLWAGALVLAERTSRRRSATNA